MGFKEKLAEKISFDVVGMVVVGKLVSMSHNETLNCNMYVLQPLDTPEGETVTFLGTTVLDKFLSTEIGNLVKIEYTGTDKTRGGRTIKMFRVWSDDGQGDTAAEELAAATTGAPKKKK
jgi:hypothetical protein